MTDNQFLVFSALTIFLYQECGIDIEEHLSDEALRKLEEKANELEQKGLAGKGDKFILEEAIKLGNLALSNE